MLDKLTKGISLELEQICSLITRRKALIEKAKTQLPSDVEVDALGAFLHAFYNGVENVLKKVIKEIDGQLPEGADSHAKLLDCASRPTSKRPAIISAALKELLKDYLGFRHVFRQAYTFNLDWEKMGPLVFGIESANNQ